LVEQAAQDLGGGGGEGPFGKGGRGACFHVGRSGFVSGEFNSEIVQQARRTAQGAVPQAIRAGVFQATGENGVKAV
jgi:hypothetical protein